MNISKVGKYLLIPFAIIISLIPIFDPFNVFSSLRNTSFDLFQNISPRESLAQNNVLILDIDEKSLTDLGQWPWSRSVLAKLVDKTYLAAALGFDIVFAESDRTGAEELIKLYKENDTLVNALEKIPNNDNLFATSIGNHGTVVLGAIPSNTLRNEFRMKFGLIEQGDDPRKFLNNFAGVQTNLDLLDDSASGIGSMSIGDNDSIIRRLPLFENIDGSLIPSLSLEL